MLSTESVWNRRNTLDEIISDRAYNLTIGAVLIWGFALNALMIQNIDPVPVIQFIGGSPLIFLVLYAASIIVGTMIFMKSDNPAISFVGYNFLVLPLGLVLVATLPFYDSSVIARAFMATASVTGIMMMLGTVYPRFFLSIGRALFVAFIATFIVEIGFFFITGARDFFFLLLAGIFFAFFSFREQ